jgi:NitT/TauT family transport system substrate-binding protein
VTEEFRSGRLDACLNYWTYAARLQGIGAREIITMAEVVKALGISPTPTLVGFIWSEKGAKEKQVPINALLAAASEANAVLAKSEEAWERLRAIVKPATDDEFTSIKAAFRAGIPQSWGSAETQSAEQLTNLLIKLGDTELVGDGTRFDPNLFYTQSG